MAAGSRKPLKRRSGWQVVSRNFFTLQNFMVIEEVNADTQMMQYGCEPSPGHCNDSSWEEWQKEEGGIILASSPGLPFTSENYFR